MWKSGKVCGKPNILGLEGRMSAYVGACLRVIVFFHWGWHVDKQSTQFTEFSTTLSRPPYHGLNLPFVQNMGGASLCDFLEFSTVFASYPQ